MPIPFTCPKCLADLLLKDQYAGECLNCPHCRAPFVVPEIDAGDEVAAGAGAQWSGADESWIPQVTPSAASFASPPDAAEPPREAAIVPDERVRFWCSACNAKMSARVALAGRQVTCPNCGHKQTIPDQQTSATTTQPGRTKAPAGSKSGPPTLPTRSASSAASAERVASMHEALDDTISVDAPTKRRAPGHLSTSLPPRKSAAGRGDGRRTWLKYLGGAGTGLLVLFMLALQGMRFLGPVRELTNTGSVELLRLQEESLNVGDRLTSVCRQIVDVDSARRLAPQWVSLLGQTATSERAEQAAVSEGRKLYGKQVEQQQRNLARGQEQQREIANQTARIHALPGVAPILNAEMERQVASDPSGDLAELLRRQGQGLAGATEQAPIASAGQSSTPVSNESHPETTKGTPPLEAAKARRRRMGVNAPPAPQLPTPLGQRPPNRPAVDPPGAQEIRQPADPASPTASSDEGIAQEAAGQQTADDNSPETMNDALETRAKVDPVATAKAQEFLKLVERNNEIQSLLLSITEQIEDDRSAKLMVRQWAVATRQRETLIERERGLAGLELSGPDAVRYSEAKSHSDQQTRDIEVETARLEGLSGVMNVLQAELQKLPAGDITIDDAPHAQKSPKIRRPTDRPLPPALKRAPANK